MGPKKRVITLRKVSFYNAIKKIKSVSMMKVQRALKLDETSIWLNYDRTDDLRLDYKVNPQRTFKLIYFYCFFIVSIGSHKTIGFGKDQLEIYWYFI